MGRAWSAEKDVGKERGSGKEGRLGDDAVPGWVGEMTGGSLVATVHRGVNVGVYVRR